MTGARAVQEFFAGLRERPPGAPALRGEQVELTYGALLREVDRFAEQLKAEGVSVLATQLDNGPAWAVADLATLAAGIVHVPLPLFFTQEQVRHTLCTVGVDAWLTGASDRDPGDAKTVRMAGEPLRLARPFEKRQPLHPGTVKVTFTSGSTGQPKGVCLSMVAMLAVAGGLARALGPLAIERHLNALPLPVLLENIAGLYAPLMAGATVVSLPLVQVGLNGSSTFDAAALQRQVERFGAQSTIVLPQMLRQWTSWRARHAAAPAQRPAPSLKPAQRPASSLKFVAVGGAAVGAGVLTEARAVGLPAYEGYGLSEGASVQTLNLPGADRPGSVGRPLPHARVRVGRDGDVEIAGSGMLGYVGGPAVSDTWRATGDIGALDVDGYLSLTGRRTNLLITAFGRNVSPEWVETALQSQPEIAQAVVFGDAEPALWAVLWASPGAHSSRESLAQAVRRANGLLPDYARVAHWVVASRPFSAAAGLATVNGRPRRAAVLAMGRDLRAPLLHSPKVSSMNPSEPRTPFAQLRDATESDRQQLVATPIIQGALRGEVSLASYVAFLTEAYHHVRQTVPLLRACRDRLPPRLHWMRSALDEYIAEESGHDEWILADIAAAGADSEAVRNGSAGMATELMVAYAYDTIARGNPLGFLGMVHVLEGTSVALAIAAADRIQQGLGLPDAAFTYLRSHGELDREHTAHFEQLVDAVDDPADRQAIVHAARMFYRLYGDVFRGLPLPLARLEAA